MATPLRTTYFKANLEDKPGALLAVLKELKAKNLGLSGLWGFSTSEGKAELYVTAKNPDKIRAAWKSSGILAEEGTGFWVKGTDKTGALLGVLEAIARAGVNIIAIDAVAVSGKFGSFVWVKPEDVERAAKALGAR
ncbi:MAG: hypothetical protein HY562_06470 [Ignavibacteriales bacterium]|nr:hypothetical protein [Ignavibacteriales bacterium]